MLSLVFWPLHSGLTLTWRRFLKYTLPLLSLIFRQRPLWTKSTVDLSIAAKTQHERDENHSHHTVTKMTHEK